MRWLCPFLILGCRSPLEMTCTAESSPLVSSLVTVSWAGDWQQLSVRYHTDTTAEQQASPQDQSALLTGIRAGETVHFEVEAEADGRAGSCSGSRSGPC